MVRWNVRTCNETYKSEECRRPRLREDHESSSCGPVYTPYECREVVGQRRGCVVWSVEDEVLSEGEVDVSMVVKIFDGGARR